MTRIFGAHWLAFCGGLAAGNGEILRDAFRGQRYDLFELACNPVNGMSADETAGALREAGIKKASYCRFFPGDGSLGDPLGDNDKVDQAVATFERDVRFIEFLQAEGLKVEHITGPSCFVLGKRYDDELEPETLQQRLIRFVNMQAASVAGKGITVCLEYLRPGEDAAIGGIKRMLALLEQVYRPEIAFHGDIFHMLERNETPWQTILKAGKWLRYLHAHGAQRMVPGTFTGDTGTTDSVNWHLVARALDTIGYDGPVVPEPFGKTIREQVPELGDGLPPAVDPVKYYSEAGIHLEKMGIL